MMKAYIVVALLVLVGSTQAALITTLESENATCEHDPSKITAVYVTAYYLDADDALLVPQASKTLRYSVDVGGSISPNIFSDAVLGNGWYVYFETNRHHQTSIPAYENTDGTPSPNIVYSTDFALFTCDGKAGCNPTHKAIVQGRNEFVVEMKNSPNVPLGPGDAVYYSALVSCFTPQELDQENVIYPNYPLLTPQELAQFSLTYCQPGYHLEYDQNNTLVCVADVLTEVPEFGTWVVFMLFAGCVIIAVSRRI